jgi:hypothetical protein
MARSDDTLIMLVIGAIGVYLAYLLFTQKGGVLDTASKAGAGFMTWLQGQWLNSSTYKAVATETAARGLVQGSRLVYVPPTPAGYAASNWTWTLKDGTSLGIPAGMTPAEFCLASPDSPICEQIRKGG